MDTACHRFFNTPELLSLLASTLCSVELAKLCRCSRKFNREFTPSLYKTLYVSGRYMIRGQTILSSMPFLVALGRNIRHVRALGMGPVELVFYYNCILAFADLQWPRSDSPPTTSSLPNWIPPADPRTCQILPLTPVTNLQHLSLENNLLSGRNYPFQLLSADNDQAVLAIFCWLIHLNPRLKYLQTRDDLTVDLAGCRLLAKAISRLSELTELDLSITCDYDIHFQVGSSIFFHCRPSIRKFELFLGEPYEDDGIKRWKLDDVSECQLDGGEQEGEPLTNLEELKCWNFEEGAAMDDILAIFARCPNVKKLIIPALSRDYDHNAIGTFIGKECPLLQSLCCGANDVRTEVVGPLAIRIMETLPAQQLENFTFYGKIFPLSKSTFTRPLQQHSTTLQKISIVHADHLTSISLGPIFERCVNIKVLDIQCHPWSNTGLYATLTDLLERPWTSVKLTHLTLGISGCELPVDPTDNQPYYNRPTPIALSKAETDHFSRLEELYRRLGTLVELTHLNLEMVAVDAESELLAQRLQCFPALMSVGDVKTGRPGYLRHLKGLKKLQSFHGSIRADTAESKNTVGLEECRWVLSHWPKVIFINFFVGSANVRRPFRWLQAQNGRLRISSV
ncbi:MAG: hypothetical protein J3R72DRAFT_441166 [Linnemannia gamsii]|nr:MAG: hypothetical protein J3R72DRAFT_441166 [Linnemannia gamsii]